MNARQRHETPRGTSPGQAVERLRALRQPPQHRPRTQHCELCSETVGTEHRHLVDTVQRRLACACTACSLLFTSPGAGEGRYRAIPERHLVEAEGQVPGDALERLRIPVGLVFLLRSSQSGTFTAFYPGPAGATEADLSDEDVADVFAGSRLAALLEPDVEALILHAPDEGHAQCYLVPVDLCYELVGRLRLHWRGFDGGAEAHEDLDTFVQTLRRRARPAPAARETPTPDETAPDMTNPSDTAGVA